MSVFQKGFQGVLIIHVLTVTLGPDRLRFRTRKLLLQVTEPYYRYRVVRFTPCWEVQGERLQEGTRWFGPVYFFLV